MHTTVPIRVILVDDHRLFSDGLCALLDKFEEVVVLEQVYDSPDTFRSVAQHHPDVILMDFNMPHMNGMEVAKRILRENPSARIIIISMYNEVRYVEDFEKLGIKGYLLKTASVEEVVGAIKMVSEGGIYFEKSRVAGNHHSEDHFLKRFRLTPREVKIIRLVKEGVSTSDMADRLGISPYTAETHRKNICTKLNLKGKNELLRFALENDF